MKKAAATQQSTPGNKGMMGMVLPMYAVGIVIYLIYTLTKVRNKSGSCGFCLLFCVKMLRVTICTLCTC